MFTIVHLRGRLALIASPLARSGTTETQFYKARNIAMARCKA
jgi:hypothetical protein